MLAMRSWRGPPEANIRLKKITGKQLSFNRNKCPYISI